MSAPLDCGSLDVVGGTSEDYSYSSFRQYTLEVEVPGAYILETSGGDKKMWVRIGPCFGCVWDDHDNFFQLGETKPLELEAGKYYLRVSGDSSASPDLTITLRPA